MTDYKLWTRWKHGDLNAADQLSIRYLRLAKKIAGCVGSRTVDDSEGLVQDGPEPVLDLTANCGELADWELWTRWKAGDRDAGNLLCIRYLPLAKMIAGRIGSGRAGDSEDRMHDGFVALLNRRVNCPLSTVGGNGLAPLAFEALLDRTVNYDPTDFPLTTFGAWVRTVFWRGMLRGKQEQQGFTRTQTEQVEAVWGAQDALMADPERGGRKPTVEKIADKTKLTVEQVYRALQIIAVGESVPLLESDHDTIEDVQSDVEQQVIRGQELAALPEALLTLKPIEREILIQYYWEDLTYREIANNLGKKTEVAVRQQCYYARIKVRDWFADQGWER